MNIMKTKEELNALKNEIETLNAKLADLTEEELEQVCGGIASGRRYWFRNKGGDVPPELATKHANELSGNPAGKWLSE